MNDKCSNSQAASSYISFIVIFSSYVSEIWHFNRWSLWKHIVILLTWLINVSVQSVSNYNFDKTKQCIGAMTIEIDFLQKKSTDSSPYDSDKMASEFIQQFNNQGFSVTQQVYPNQLQSIITHNTFFETHLVLCFCSIFLFSLLSLSSVGV